MRGERYTMAEARAMSRRTGAGLVSLGAEAGDVVAVLLPNMPEYVFAVLGASEAALRVTPLNPSYTASKQRQPVFRHLMLVMLQRKSIPSSSTARPG